MRIDYQIILNFIITCIHLPLSAYWAVVFMKRIHCSSKYKKGATRCITDEESLFVNEQICVHYETEIWKYVYLLGISLFEILTGLLYFITNVISRYIINSREFNGSSLLFPLSKCNINATVNDNITTSSVFSLYHFLHGIGRSTELFWVVLSMCLMNYLIVRLKKIKLHHNTRKSFYLMLITIWLCLFILFSNLIQTLRFLSSITCIIVTTAYACMFVRTCDSLKRALLQRALERLIQYGSNNIEMKEYRYFKYTINLICCLTLSVYTGQILIYIPHYIVGVVVNQMCYFPINLFPRFYYIEQSKEFIDVMSKVSHYTNVLGTVLCYIGLSLVTGPFILITINIWITHILKFIRSTPKIRYTTLHSSLVTPMITK